MLNEKDIQELAEIIGAPVDGIRQLDDDLDAVDNLTAIEGAHELNERYGLDLSELSDDELTMFDLAFGEEVDRRYRPEAE